MKQTNRTIALIILFLLSLHVKAQQSEEIKIPIPQWHITQMTQDREGMIWFATWNGLCRYDGYDFVVFKNKPGDGIDLRSDRIRGVVLGKDGNLYCRVEDEIFRFNLTTYQYEPTTHSDTKEVEIQGYGYTKDKESYINNAQWKGVNRVFTDQQGNVWLLRKYGASKIVKAYPPMKHLETVSRKTVRCLYHDRQNQQIWIGTKEDGIVTILDEQANLIGYLNSKGMIGNAPTSVFPAYSIARTSPKTLWIGTKPNGLYRLHQQTPLSYSIEKIPSTVFPTDNIYDMKMDKQGRLWLATHGEGIYVCNNPESETPVFSSLVHLMKDMKEEATKVRRIYPTPDGKRVLAATVGGLLVIDNIESNNTAQYRITLHRREPDRAASLSNSATMNIIIPEKEGEDLYVSTESGGVNRLLSTTLSAQHLSFQHLGQEQGICPDNALSITKMGDDILIISVSEVTIYSPSTGKSRSYNSHFWCAPLLFSEVSPLRLNDGRWLIALQEGVIVTPEKAWNQKPYIPKIAISSVKIEGYEPRYNVTSIDSLTLSSDQRNVTINFAALDFCADQHMKYQTNFNSTEWSVPSENNSISLYDLTPGEHTLQIRSTNAQGLWTDNTRTLHIIVSPHWYETTWAKLTYLLLIVITVSGITHLINYIRTINRERRETLEAYLALLHKSTVQDNEDKEEIITQEIPYSIPASRQNPEDEAFMAKLLTYVDKNISNSDASVDDMAEAVAMSRSSLTRKTKQLLGITPAELLREARMKHACQLLKENTHRTTSEVAYACGFSDPKYFAKCFKSSVGVSPKSYRE